MIVAIDLPHIVCEPPVGGGPVKRYSNNVVTTDPDDHQWAVVLEACDIDALDDGMLRHAVDAIRAAYGEQEIRDLAENEPLLNIPDPAEGIGAFETDHLIKAFRSSLPDPAAEGAKPVHLTNYRSETTEIIAREALNAVFGMATPPALHATKGNRNQPILGFDGWSVMNKSTGELALSLFRSREQTTTSARLASRQSLLSNAGKSRPRSRNLRAFSWRASCAARIRNIAHRCSKWSSSSKRLVRSPI